MAVLSVTRHGFVNIDTLMSNIASVLTSSSHPNLTNASVGYFEHVIGTHTAGQTVIYKSTVNIDVLANHTPSGTTISAGWRLAFRHHDNDRMSVAVGTELQYPDSGTVAMFTNRAVSVPATIKEMPGAIGAPWTGATPGEPAASTTVESFNEVFLNRQQVIAGSEGAYPMSYTLTLTNRGIFLAIWEASQEESDQTFQAGSPTDYYSNSPLRWFLIQRSVDRISGHVRGGAALRGNSDPFTETSRCPVFCVFGSGAPNSYRRFVVRENDVLTPSRKKLVSESSEDVAAMINPYQQNSITESGEFIVTFLTNLTTSRYRYSDELDMLGTVGAEVIGPGTSINVKVYNESTDRQYTALYANMPYGVGMRLMVLTQGNATTESTHI